MRLVPQKHAMGCGVAAVANLLSIDYSKALGLFRGGKKNAINTGFLCKDMVTAINKAGKNYQYKYIKPNIRKKIYNPGTIVFIRRSKRYLYGHYLTRTKDGWMDPWINIKSNNNIKEAIAGIRKRLPGKPIYAILKL